MKSILEKLSKYDILALFIALIALVIRFWNLKLNKALWWDEASFLVIAQRIATGTSCLWEPHRLPGLSVLLSPFYAIFGLNIDIFKVVVILFSGLSVLSIYFLGKKMFNSRIGLVASILLALSWLNYFYSLRILSRVPAAFFLIVCVYLFWEGWNKKSWKLLSLAGIVWGFYYTIRFDAVFVLAAFALFILFELLKSEKKVEFLKRKEIWIFLLACLIAITPYLIWQTVVYGSPIYQIQLNYELTRTLGQGPLTQFNLMQHSLSSGVLILFGIGLIFSALKLKDSKYRLLLLIFTVFFVGLAISPYHEDRYLLPLLPIILLISAIGLEVIVSLIIKNKSWKTIAILIVAILLGVLCMSYGWGIIESKGGSYESVQNVGMALSDLPNDLIYVPFAGNSPMPQLCLWDKDKTYKDYPEDAEEFYSNFKTGELAYCSVGYDTCPSYLLERPTSNDGLQNSIAELESQGITIVLANQDEVGAISFVFEKIESEGSE